MFVKSRLGALEPIISITKCVESFDKNFHLLGEPLGEYHKIESIKTINIYISAYQAILSSYMKLRNTEVSLINMNMYHLELTPESYEKTLYELTRLNDIVF